MPVSFQPPVPVDFDLSFANRIKDDGFEQAERADHEHGPHIRRFEECDLVDIAEMIDASVGTISNAANGKADLSGVYLMRLGQAFGSGYLNPYLRMCDAQAAPLDGSLTADILPLVMAVGHKIAQARDPKGPGGAIEVPQEKAGYLPELKKLQTRSAHLVKEIEAAL